MSMYEIIGANNPTYLLADPQGAETIAIPCAPNNGVIPRGTVMYRNNNGQYEPAASNNVAVTSMLVILDETVDTTASATAEDARAFRTGRFIIGKVVLASGAALSAANIVVLRNQGILFDRMTAIVNVTYKANGGTGSDVTVSVEYMQSYTTKAGTIFTAPASKSFSKWNTKADGSGTDVNASTAITIAEDMELYAIWAS